MAASKKLTVNPLTANDIAAAQAVIDTYPYLEELAAKCQSCGLDVQPILDQGKAYADFARSVKSQFGSGTDELS